MNNYQFGNELSFVEVLKDKKKYARIFSEGDKYLERLLNYCFNHHLETNLCCAGHSEEEPMYIKFNISRNSQEQINQIIGSVINNYKVNIELCKRANDDYASFWIMSYYLGEGEQIFNNIYYALKEGKVFTKIHPNFSLLLKMVKGFNYSDYDLTLGTKGAEKGKKWFCTLQYVKMKNNKILSRHDLLYKEFNMTNH